MPDDPSTYDRRQLASATPKLTSDLAQPQAQEQRSESQRDRLPTWEWRLRSAVPVVRRGVVRHETRRYVWEVGLPNENGSSRGVREETARRDAAIKRIARPRPG